MKQIFSLLLALCLSGCAHTIHHPDTTPAQNKDESHDARVQTLGSKTQWNLRGQMAVNDGKKAWSAQVVWKQRGNNYDVQLFGPFAGGTVKIVGRPGKVSLVDASGRKNTAKSLNDLFAEQTGYQLPLSSMIYWIKAMPTPNTPAKKQFDQFQHLSTLVQQGWQISYLRYTSDQGVDLPSKINMNNANLKIKLVISRWRLLA